MYFEGDVIDEKYRVLGTANDSGGMGALLFVEDIADDHPFQLVLKYCRETAEEYVQRFRREVRLLAEFNGNAKVVELVNSNVDHEPPYFVMRYYEEGDLTNLSDRLDSEPELQEKVFLEMIDCISELHARNKYHRDIKPQNFLLGEHGVLVSDFGLSMEIGSGTGFTRSSVHWGTHGYLPPEFLNHGGFKNADASGDIFMLGKSFYALLTNRDPMYLLADGIEPPIFHVIERACATSKEQRYQSLSELKQSLVMAYDVLLQRGGQIAQTQQLLSAINDLLKQEKKYDSAQCIEFIEKLALLDETDKIRMCFEIDKRFFVVLKQSPVVSHLSEFLTIYRKMVESADYGWSYGEVIATNMTVLFYGEEVPNKLKAQALELAIDAAYQMNRFAAMDTCRNMITGVTDDALAVEVAAVILGNAHSFIQDIEQSECKADPIRVAINSINQDDAA